MGARVSGSRARVGSTVQGGGKLIYGVVEWVGSRGRGGGKLIYGAHLGDEGSSGVCHTLSVEERWERNAAVLFVGCERHDTQADCRAEYLLGVVLIYIH